MNLEVNQRRRKIQSKKIKIKVATETTTTTTTTTTILPFNLENYLETTQRLVIDNLE